MLRYQLTLEKANVLRQRFIDGQYHSTLLAKTEHLMFFQEKPINGHFAQVGKIVQHGNKHLAKAGFVVLD